MKCPAISNPGSFVVFLMLAALAGAANGQAGSGSEIRYVGKARYLNGAFAVVTHTIDDSTKYVPQCLDAMDKYGIKATVFVSTERPPIQELWPRLEQAFGNGHEIGSHSRTHQCKWPDDSTFCDSAYSPYEVTGSREDILAQTTQPYVWSWCYPCGNCAGHRFIQHRLALAGYIVARNYPDEAKDGHIRPDLQTWAENPFHAAYTQVVQKKGGIALSGNTDVEALNAKFDEVHRNNGIYHFLSHPQWLDYGPENFYERHLAYIGRRPDVWYVPMGPLYAYRRIREKTEVRQLLRGAALARFTVSHDLDPRVYTASLTLEFIVPDNGNVRIYSKGQLLPEAPAVTDRWTGQYFRRDGEHVYVTVKPNATIEFRAAP